MIKTTPTYIKGDNLSFKEYFKHVFAGEHLLYTSRWKWWKLTTLYTGIPVLASGIVILVSFLYHVWKSGEEMDWVLMSGSVWIPFIVFMPFIWLVSYYYSFVLSGKITRKLQDFIGRYFPGVTEVYCYRFSNYMLFRNDVQFEIAYTMVPEMSLKGKTLHTYECFVAGVYFPPMPGTERKWMDAEKRLTAAFWTEWEVYCRDKESCQNLIPYNGLLTAVFKCRELPSPDGVARSLDQMEYLLKKFEFYPLAREFQGTSTVRRRDA